MKVTSFDVFVDADSETPPCMMYLISDMIIRISDLTRIGGDATTINVSRWNFVKTDIVINGH